MTRPLINPLFFGPLSGTVDNRIVSHPNDPTVYYGVTMPNRSVVNLVTNYHHPQSSEKPLLQLFAEAHSALHTPDQPEATLIWQPTVHHNPGSTSRSRRKRDAATAGLLTDAEIEAGAKTPRTNSQATVKNKPRRGRPRGSTTKPPQPSKPLTLSISRPVKQELPLDIWDQIVRYSDLKCAISISKMTRDHQELLSKSSLWKAVRHHVYGSDHPDPPPGITERQYAQLITGIGCQDKGCNNNRAKDTCWAAQRRWCVSCLRKKTISVDSCGFFLKKYPEITKYVTRIDLANFTILKDSYHDNSSSFGFLRKDLARAADEVDHAVVRYGCSVQDRASNLGFQAWLDTKATTHNVLVEKLQAIESWWLLNKAKVREEARLKKQARSTFFTGKALSLDPPLDLAALEQLECFRQAVVSKAKPSERAWKSLKNKIRSEQVRQQQQQQITATRVSPCVFYDLEWIEEEERPEGTDQDFASTIQMRVDAMEGSFDKGKPTEYSDFVRVTLDTIYEENEQGSYEDDLYEYPQLTMSIAKDIYDAYLAEERIDDLVESKKLFGAVQLICPACKDGNAREQKNFLTLMNHIWDCHLDQGPGSDASFVQTTKQKYTTFPWDHIKWPKTLPILPVGQTASECKIRLTRTADGHSAFKGRAAATHIGQGQPDFAGNVLFAASLLEETGLEDKYRTQIALKYACQRWSKRSLPSRIQFEELQTALVRNGVSGLFEGFRCQKCCEAARDGGTVGYFARSVKPLAKLSEHYFNKHNPDVWSREMLSLPTPQELLMQLRLPRNEKAYSVFLRLFPAQADVTIDPQLRSNRNVNSGAVEGHELTRNTIEGEGEDSEEEAGSEDEEDDEEEQGSEDDEDEVSDEEGDE